MIAFIINALFWTLFVAFITIASVHAFGSNEDDNLK